MPNNHFTRSLSAIAREAGHWYECYMLAIALPPSRLRRWEQRVYAAKMDNAQSRFVVVLNRYAEQLRIQGVENQTILNTIARTIIDCGMA